MHRGQQPLGYNTVTGAERWSGGGGGGGVSTTVRRVRPWSAEAAAPTEASATDPHPPTTAMQTMHAPRTARTPPGTSSLSNSNPYRDQSMLRTQLAQRRGGVDGRCALALF